MKQTIYLSIDIESNGSIPGTYSMLSFGVAAFKDGELINTFERNLMVLPDAREHPDTMKWWKDNQEAYKKTRINIIPPLIAMNEYIEWQKKLIGNKENRLTYVAAPFGFDHMFIYWYAKHFTGTDMGGFSGIDMRSYMSAFLKKPYHKVGKSSMPARWKVKYPHTHVAIEDAIEQGYIVMNMMKEFGII